MEVGQQLSARVIITQMFGWIKKRRGFDDHQKLKFVDAISGILEIQMTFAPHETLEDRDGKVNPKALGTSMVLSTPPFDALART
jgi:hypothetical protein